ASTGRPLLINVAPMAYVENRNDPDDVFDLVQHPVAPHADAPAFAPDELFAAGGTWLRCQRADRVAHAFVVTPRQLRERFLGTPQDLNLVAHRRACSISRTACS